MSRNSLSILHITVYPVLENQQKQYPLKKRTLFAVSAQLIFLLFLNILNILEYVFSANKALSHFVKNTFETTMSESCSSIVQEQQTHKLNCSFAFFKHIGWPYLCSKLSNSDKILWWKWMLGDYNLAAKSGFCDTKSNANNNTISKIWLTKKKMDIILLTC